MFSTVFYPDSFLYFLVKLIVLALAIALWMAVTPTPVA